ncbi:MAG TPA: mechanosensitive ion channel domain-containing protein, partial [Spongiibacteraceae bacterium]|nr:mechanosensitive ion channel domain-containing protein [Spongiibacteraceae bacterium]
LSSTTVMGNLIAGFMLRAISRLHAGDFIRTESQFGRITERGLLHVEIQTEDSDLTTLPNLTLVQQPFTVIRASGTIISAEVSLGYDVNHVDIEQALLKAAENAGLEDAFVQIRNLGDFSVLYRLCGRLTNVHQIVSRRSQLRAAMLDALHAAHIEIVSPTFMNQRQLTPQQRFIPHPATAKATHDNGEMANIEELLFDKAEKAHLAERARALRESIAIKIEELTKEKNALPRDDKTRDEIAQRIDHYSGRAERIKMILEEINANSGT